MERVCGEGVWRGCVERMCGEGVWRECVERVCGEGVWRGCVERVCLLYYASFGSKNLRKKLTFM